MNRGQLTITGRQALPPSAATPPTPSRSAADAA